MSGSSAKRPGGLRHHAASFLVRFWREPRENGEGEPVVRGYLRSLQTGEETYLTGTAELDDSIRRRLDAEIKETDPTTTRPN